MMKFKPVHAMFLFVLAVSCAGTIKSGTKSSNRLLDEFRVDEYRGYVVISKNKRHPNFTDISMYSEEKKRFVFVKIPNWLAEYWEEGDTIR